MGVQASLGLAWCGRQEAVVVIVEGDEDREILIVEGDEEGCGCDHRGG